MPNTQNELLLPRQYATAVIVQHLQPGDWALDATVGNGHDTLTLARAVGPTGLVVGVDIQRVALQRAAARLQAAAIATPVHLVCADHQYIDSLIIPTLYGRFAAAMLNLGYLPQSDHKIITQPDTTRRALDASLHLLAPGGILSVVVYTEHAGGAAESAAVRAWAGAVSPYHRVIIHEQLPQHRSPPWVLIVVCMA